jgi:hypothetical protein
VGPPHPPSSDQPPSGDSGRVADPCLPLRPAIPFTEQLLVVHPENQGAIKLYQDFNFRLFGKPRKDGYQRMVATFPEENLPSTTA